MITDFIAEYFGTGWQWSVVGLIIGIIVLGCVLAALMETKKHKKASK